MHIAILCISAVAICTERVEAKRGRTDGSPCRDGCNLHGACGGKGVPAIEAVNAAFVAICTERVEAKTHAPRTGSDTTVAICTERVEAKLSQGYQINTGSRVAICTERVEAKRALRHLTSVNSCCNLHGACGGKELSVENLSSKSSCNLHGACGGKDCVKPVSDTLYRCNLHGACGGKGALQFHPYY